MTDKIVKDGATGRWVNERTGRYTGAPSPLSEFGRVTAGEYTVPASATVKVAPEHTFTGSQVLADNIRENNRLALSLMPEAIVPGVGPDAPTETNAAGASQSAIPYAVASLDAGALLAAARVAAQGDAKYGVDNWRKIPTRDHLNHLLTHVLAYLAGDRSDEHLAHAICRALMAHACEGK